ncbi:MAG: response regulator [Burkholderiales bacterium]
MPERKPSPDELLVLTDQGRQELQSASTSCAPQELELLVLIDGKTGSRAVASRAKSTPASKVPLLLERLVKAGLAARAEVQAEGLGYSFFSGGERLVSAAQEADDGTADLQRKGYYVSIARRGARERAPAAGVIPGVLIIEDDSVLAKMLGHLMTLEGLAPRMAFRAAEIQAELSRKPPPHLVLLDVVLPDADGFDILQRIKHDPALRDIPVILVTGRTTRESVMRGLAAGADGYITKPIQYEALALGVKSVLGLGDEKAQPRGADGNLDLDDTLTELSKEYRNGVGLKVARMEELAKGLARGLPKRAEFDELKRFAHTMSGTAPTFGLAEVGAAAKLLEEALIVLGESPQGDPAAARKLLSALRTIANAAR